MRVPMVGHRGGSGKIRRRMIEGFSSEIPESHIRDSKTAKKENSAEELPLSTFTHRR